jgi:hypothetical protein
MSTKKLLPRPVAEKFFVSISSPLFADVPLDRSSGFALACGSVPLVSFSRGDSARRFLKLGKRFDFVATLVLSEALGLWLFLVLRGGIA